ncbi:Clp protease N-terminal domain-containing protein [Streptomyces sp. NPDC058953]|uniref:Clp protease N-terminal domain-containing protein n=1 Tax=unclassified Streptomyces TaxID=2593676 RepID=UPI00369DB509
MTRQLFGAYAETIIESGADEARLSGSATIEAEHLLLSIAAEQDSAVAPLLAAAGLDHAAIRLALRREFCESLRAAGVSIAEKDLPEPCVSTGRPSRMGQSAKLAFERGITAAGGKKDLRPGHLLLGVLRLELGTVPRALALAGVDRAALRESVEQSLRD